MPLINKTTLKRLIAENKPQEVLEQLWQAEFIQNNSELLRQLTLYMSQWQACRRDRLSELITWEEADAKNQRVNNALLHFIEELPNQDIQLVLPPLPETIKRPSVPFTGLHWFTWDDAPVFFGRQKDIQSLYNQITEGERIILLYGQSGVGKSSLLHAGLLPRLEYRWKDIKENYHRRDPEVGIPAVLEELLRRGKQEERIVVLDQLEEIFTNPTPTLTDEPFQFSTLLTKAVQEFPHLQFILGFRKEYMAEFKDLLDVLDPATHFLKPLDRDDILVAITGVVSIPHLQRKYHLSIEEGLPKIIADDILRDAESNIAPLLQILLRKMWDAASEKIEDGEVRFTYELYASLRQSSLDRMLDGQLEELSKEFPEAIRSGLVLDVLMGYTTARATAGEMTDEKLQQKYPHIPYILALKIALQKLFLLTDLGKQDRSVARLAHDALAPIIRKKYFDSDAPGQRARRIVETKEREIGFLASFSETDIDTILAGEDGMQKIPDQVREMMKDDQERYKKQKRERFHLAFDTAHVLIGNLKYKEALEKLWIASREHIYQDLLREQALELPFFFLQTGRVELFKESLNFIQKMGKERDKEIVSLLDMANQQWEHKHNLSLRKKLEEWNPDLFRRMEERFFPKMREIPGGTYRMGSEEGPEREHPVHEVGVSNFYLADVPITFWQYGLFCMVNGLDLPSDSGFGRGAKPVINVTWYDAIEYCNWLTEWLNPLKEGVKLEKVYAREGNKVYIDLSKNGFRLPTEAEWEYAAREGGKNIRFGNGKDIANPQEVNFDPEHPYNEKKPEWFMRGEGRSVTTTVRTFIPNAFGLYDMSGNVFEWCWDWWSEGLDGFYSESEGKLNPIGPNRGDSRIVRGGSWRRNALDCRNTYRGKYHPMVRDSNIGFRLAQSS